MLLMALMAPWAMQGQVNDLTIYEDGDATSDYVPVYGYWADAYLKCEFIVPASELDYLLPDGVISEMKFYLSTPAAADVWGTFQVFLKEVDATTLSAYTGTDGATIVYEGGLDGTGATMDVPFTTNYAYNGGNLLVGVYQTVKGNYKSAQFRGVTATGACVQGYNSSSLASVSVNQRNFIPTTTFYYTGGYTPSCFKPQNLAATLTPGNGSIATLNWERHPNGTETAWVLQYGTDETFEAGTYTEVTANTNPTKDLTGLTPETTYYARVKPDCDTDGSLWTAAISFTPTDSYTLIVNDGNNSNSYVPFYGYYADSYAHSQFIIPAEDIEILQWGTINKLLFHSSVTSATWSGAEYEIYMMEVDTTAFANNEFIDWTDDNWTLVYTGGVALVDNIMEFDLDTPFEYTDGNLLIGFYETETSSNYPSASWYGVNQSKNTAIYQYNNGNITLAPFLPKITIDYIPGEQPSCFKPKNLAANDITAHGATITWASDDSAWEVRLAGGRSNNVTEKTYTFSNLTSETEYTAEVRTNCGNGDYSDWAAITFTTAVACPASTATVDEVLPESATVSIDGPSGTYNLHYRVQSGFHFGFEDVEAWTITDFDPCTTYDGDLTRTYGFEGVEFPNQQYTGACIAWQNGTMSGADAHSGNACGMIVNAIKSEYPTGVTHTDDFFILPELTISAGEVFSFWAKEISTSYGPELINVGIYDVDGTFTTLFAEELAISTTTWTQYTYPLDDYAGQTIQLAINCVSDDVWAFMFDDIFVGDPNDDTWDYTLTGIESPYEITGLTENTYYEFQVQSDCDEEGTSAWSETYTFHTPLSCTTPYDLTTTDVTAFTATLNWDGIDASYNVRYRTTAYREQYYLTTFNTSDERDGWTSDGTIYGLADPIYGVASDNNFFFAMGWSTQNEEVYIISPELPEYPSGSYFEFYHFKYSTASTFQVGYSVTTDDTDAFTWGDPITAGDSYTLYSEKVASGIKYVAFKATVSAQSACVFIDDFGIFSEEIPAGDWITEEEVVAKTLDIENLTGNKDYEWQVQGINENCDGGLTDWSASAFFTTEPSCLVPEDFQDTETYEDGALLTWTSDAAAFDILVDNELLIEEIEGNEYLLEGLEPQTIYSVKIRANCGGGDYSDWTSSIEFVTECGGAKDIPYTYDFQDLGDYYACWLATNLSSSNPNSPGLALDPANSNNIVFRFSSYSSSSDGYEQILIMPELNATNDFTVQFDYKQYSSSSGEVFAVGYATELSLDAFTWFDDITAESSEWTTLDALTIPAGTKYVAVIYESYYDYYLYLDNFVLEEVSGTTQTTDLIEGWNWFSTYIAVDDPVDMLDMLKASLGTNADEIQSFLYSTEFDGEEWFGDLDDEGIFNNETYLIYANTDCTVELSGTPAVVTEYSITINPGWNWIGFPSADGIEVADAMFNFDAYEGDMMQTKENSTEFDGDEWFGDLETFVPGEGVMYFSNDTDSKTLIFATGAEKAVRNSKHVTGTLSKQSMEKNTINNDEKVEKAINKYTKSK